VKQRDCRGWKTHDEQLKLRRAAHNSAMLGAGKAGRSACRPALRARVMINVPAMALRTPPPAREAGGRPFPLKHRRREAADAAQQQHARMMTSQAMAEKNKGAAPPTHGGHGDAVLRRASAVRRAATLAA